jgi:tetratricopeptide (TPR) repeat protein
MWWVLVGLLGFRGLFYQEVVPGAATFESALARGVEAEGRGRLEAAAAAFREAARLRPDQPYPRYYLARVLARGGRLTEALAEIQVAIEIKSAEASFHVLLGSVYRSLDNPELAERAFSAALDIDPDSGEALLAIADFHQSRQEFERSAGALRGYLKSRPEDVEVLYFLGSVLSYQNKPEESLEALNRVVERDPSHHRAWFRKAHLEAGEPSTMSRALGSYERSLALDPHQAYAQYEYGALLGKLGRPEEAEAALRRAVEIDPELGEAHYALGGLYSRQGRTEQARHHLDRFEALRKEKAEETSRSKRALAAFGRGRELLEKDRLDEAIESLLEATELSPRSHQAYAFLAKAYRSRDEAGVAIGYLRRAMELSPGTSEYPFLLAMFLRDRGDVEGAVAAARRAVMLSPENGLLHNALGTLLADAGDPESATVSFERAVELAPEDPAAHLNLAAAYEKLGLEEKAAAALERYRRATAPQRR